MKTRKPDHDDPSAELASTNSRPNDYPVGYRKPPVKSRFAKGVSGNPAGRPRGSRQMRKSLKAVLAEKITVNEGGRTFKISKYEALHSILVSAALKGDLKALLKIFSLVPYSEVAERSQSPRLDGAVTAEEAIAEYIKFVGLSE